MQNLQSCLCLRCSDKDKWLLFYFTLGLDCNTSVLESLYCVSLAVLVLREPRYNLDFALRLKNTFQSQLVARLGSGERPHTNLPLWRNDNAILEMQSSYRFNQEYDLAIECIRIDKTFVRVVFSLEGDILKFRCGYNDSPKMPFRLGLFEWVIEAFIEDIVNFYLS
jgi:hypothetical protein